MALKDQVLVFTVSSIYNNGYFNNIICFTTNKRNHDDFGELPPADTTNPISKPGPRHRSLHDRKTQSGYQGQQSPGHRSR